MVNVPMPQFIYRHFKGKLYQIISLAEHTETGEQLVVYQALYGKFKVYAESLSTFMERLDPAQYPDAGQEHRFELVGTAGAAETEEREKTDWETEPGSGWKNEAEAKPKFQAEPGSQVKSEPLEASAESTSAIQEEVLDIDPLVIQFLDAKTYEERLNILTALHHRITDDMINIMAVAVDIEIKEGDVEERYVELRKCLLLYDKFECTRLR